MFLCLQSFGTHIRYFDEQQIENFAKSLINAKKESITQSIAHSEVDEVSNYYDQLSWDKSAKYKTENSLLSQLQRQNIDDNKFDNQLQLNRNSTGNDNHSSVLLYHEYHRRQKDEKSVDLILTIKMWATYNFLIIFPISVYSGVTQGFQFGEFGALIEKDSYTFYALATFGLLDAVCSNLFGVLSDKIGRIPILCIAIFAHGAVYIFLYLYHEHISQDIDALWIWMLLGGVLGIGDAGFNTQILSLYPILLGDRPESFANFNLWQSASSCWCFFWHSFVSFKVKCATYFGVLLFAAIPIFLTKTGRQAAKSKKFQNTGH